MKLKLIILFVLSYFFSFTQTLRINEVSNGPSGSKEWIELVVVPISPTSNNLGTCFTNALNCAGWIIDDNNGDFSPNGLYISSGIADGHMRLKNVPPWTKLPVGAIIVIYNSKINEKDLLVPPDDIYDINNDCVYIIPDSSSTLEYCSNAPRVLNCSTVVNYSSCSNSGYLNFNGTSRSWSAIGLGNDGDAMQIRDPSFNLIHGIVYGKAKGNNCNNNLNLVGNALVPYIQLPNNDNGLNKTFLYDGINLNGYFDATKWKWDTASRATPGGFNNVNNKIWIKDTIRKNCICDVILDRESTEYMVSNIREIGFKYMLQGNDIIFYSDVFTDVFFRLYSTDGRLILNNEIRFINFYQYMIPKGIYILTMDVKYLRSQKQLTIKIMNL